jgi:YD repeat-containing protein
LGNTLSTTYAYDPLSFRLTAIKTGKGTLLQNLAYAYDPVGNVKAITDTVNSGQVITFTYDALDRLVSAKTTAAGTGQYFEN